MRTLPTLKRAGSSLASPTAQLAILDDPQRVASGTFDVALQRAAKGRPAADTANQRREFLAGHRVRIIASLPCYLEQN
jgi:hypothetical protein